MKNLRELRKSKGYMTNFIAKKLNISCRHLERIENGQGFLTKERAYKLSNIYKVNANKIIKIYKRSEALNAKNAKRKK